jgi:hypothetical protein
VCVSTTEIAPRNIGEHGYASKKSFRFKAEIHEKNVTLIACDGNKLRQLGNPLNKLQNASSLNSPAL